MTKPVTLPFSVISYDDIADVGERGVQTSELFKKGFPVPHGFLIPGYVYFQFMRSNNLLGRITDMLSTINYDRHESVQQVSEHINRMIFTHEIPSTILLAINAAYTKLGGLLKLCPVTITSSPALSGLLHNPYPAKSESQSGIVGEANLFIAIRRTWSHMFTTEMLLYRREHGLDHFRVGMAIIIQKTVDADISGHIFTIDEQKMDKNKIIIEAVYGEVESISSDQEMPDRYEVNKTSLTPLSQTINTQKKMLKTTKGITRTVSVSEKMQEKPKLTPQQVIVLAEFGKKLDHYYYFPQEIFWAIENGRIYILQSRKMNLLPFVKKQHMSIQTSTMQLLLSGIPITRSVSSGIVKIIDTPANADKLRQGDILVTSHITPEFKHALKKVNGFICEKGNTSSFAAVLARETGIPAIVGAENALQVLKNGMIVTINGENGNIYKGSVLTSHHLALAQQAKNSNTATKVFAAMNIRQSLDLLRTNHVDGVAFAPLDSLIRQQGIHPEYLILHGKKEQLLRQLILELEKISDLVRPSPLLYIFSDLTTADYDGLKNGAGREPFETNPFLGYHGASRILASPEVLRLEIEALKILTETKQMRDIRLVVPFVRTVKELSDVKITLANEGIERGQNFSLWLSVDTPVNAILLEQFIAQGIDGIHVNLDNLTSLLMGLDKNSHYVAHLYDEQNPAVMWVLEHVIKTANKHYLPSAISLHNSHYISTLFVKKLVEWGMDILAVPLNKIESIRKIIADEEMRKITKKESFIAN